MVNCRKTRHEIYCSVFRDWWSRGPTGKLTVKILVLSTRTVGPKRRKTSLVQALSWIRTFDKPPSRCKSSRFQIPIKTNIILGCHLIHVAQIHGFQVPSQGDSNSNHYPITLLDFFLRKVVHLQDHEDQFEKCGHVLEFKMMVLTILDILRFFSFLGTL